MSLLCSGSGNSSFRSDYHVVVVIMILSVRDNDFGNRRTDIFEFIRVLECGNGMLAFCQGLHGLFYGKDVVGVGILFGFDANFLQSIQGGLVGRALGRHGTHLDRHNATTLVDGTTPTKGHIGLMIGNDGCRRIILYCCPVQNTLLYSALLDCNHMQERVDCNNQELTPSLARGYNSTGTVVWLWLMMPDQ